MARVSANSNADGAYADGSPAVVILQTCARKARCPVTGGGRTLMDVSGFESGVGRWRLQPGEEPNERERERASEDWSGRSVCSLVASLCRRNFRAHLPVHEINVNNATNRRPVKAQLIIHEFWGHCVMVSGFLAVEGVPPFESSSVPLTLCPLKAFEHTRTTWSLISVRNGCARAVLFKLFSRA